MPSICFLIFILISVAPWDQEPDLAKVKCNFLAPPPTRATFAERSFRLFLLLAQWQGHLGAGGSPLYPARSCSAEPTPSRAWLVSAGLGVHRKGPELPEA